MVKTNTKKDKSGGVVIHDKKKGQQLYRDEKANTSIYLAYSMGDEGLPSAANYNVEFFNSGELKAIYI